MRSRRRKTAAPTLAVTLRRALGARRQVFGQEYRRCLRTGFAADPVHELRVGSRRLIAALDLAAPALSARRARRARKQLVRNLKWLGPLRDLHVQCDLGRELLRRHPGLKPYVAFLAADTCALVDKAVRELDRARLEKGERRLRAALASYECGERGGQRIAAAWRARFKRVRRRLDRVRPGDPSTIHRVRVAFKWFRYMAEILSGCDARLTPAVLKRLRALQSLMGAIQDLTVARAHLAEYQAKAVLPARVVRQVRAELARDQKRLIRRFLRQRRTILALERLTT